MKKSTTTSASSAGKVGTVVREASSRLKNDLIADTNKPRVLGGDNLVATSTADWLEEERLLWEQTYFDPDLDEFNEIDPFTYSEFVYKHVTQIAKQHPFVHGIVGLSSEAGEVAGILEKVLRKKNGFWAQCDKNELKDELGDCLFYIQELINNLDTDIEDIMFSNMIKLEARVKNANQDRA